MPYGNSFIGAMTACAPPSCVSVACADVCTAMMPWVVWELLVNIVMTPLYFLLRLLQYLHAAERGSW